MRTPPHVRRRLSASAGLVAGITAVVACAAGTTAHGALSTSATHSPRTSIPPTSSTPPPAPPAGRPDAAVLEPGGTTRLLPGNRIVAFYGAADTPALGVLGTASAAAIWPRLARQAAAFRTPSTPVIPAYELIADVIQHAPGADGDYEVQEPDAVIASYLAAAHAHHALLILDVQPGRSSFLPLAQRLAKYLVDPSVGLALDPEWRLAAGQVPDGQVGRVSAAEIDQTSAWLDALTRSHRLPQKLLVIHQFQIAEITAKSTLLARPSLATVINMDGFGPRAVKLASYRAVAAGSFPLGLKLFYQADTQIFTPAEALALAPSPQVIDYE